MPVVISFPTTKLSMVRIERQRISQANEKDRKIAALERELALTNRFLEIAERELVRRDEMRDACCY